MTAIQGRGKNRTLQGVTSTTVFLRVLFAGGGTGGHLFPGIAVAHELLHRQPAAEVLFAGAGRELEAHVLAREGFPLERVRAVGLVGRSPRAVAKGLGALLAAFFDAGSVLRRHRPDLVVGLGGYSSGPVVLLAAVGGVPTLLLEQNAVPGVTNRLLSRVVRAAAVSFEETASYFGARAFCSGNPVRTTFFEARAPTVAPANPRILVLGGSQGAHALNLAMIGAAPSLLTGTRRIHITHQSGQTDLELVRDGYRLAGVLARVEPFLDKMAVEMSHADLVVCRAGATTLAELAAAGRPAILVPFPFAANDHQRLNAAAVASVGAADVIDPNELTEALLAEQIRALIADDARRMSMADASRQRARPDAARLIVDRMERLTGHA